jgi:dihydroneopterin aldolase
MSANPTQIIKINGMEFYAFHGCMDEEAVAGGKYVVNIEIIADVQNSLLSDDLNDTIDYVKVYELVKSEMMVRSKLIEHVAGRIMNQMKALNEKIQGVKVEIIKIKPPIPGNLQSVSFVFEDKINP